MNTFLEHRQIIEAESNSAKWVEKYPALAHLNDWVRLTTSVILENQRLFNDLGLKSCAETCMGEAAERIIVQSYPNLVVHKIASLQPALGPHCRFTFNENRDYTYPCFTRMLKFTIPVGDLNESEIAEKMVRDIDNEVLCDVRNNVGSAALSAQMSDLYGKVIEVGNIVKVKSGQSAGMFVVVSPAVAEAHAVVLNRLRENGYAVHTAEWSGSEVIIGTRPSIQNAGYLYGPYVPIATAPRQDGSSVILTRYAKALPHPRFFACLKFKA